MGEKSPFGRRKVLKATATSALVGTSILGKVSANNPESNPAIALRSSPQNPLSGNEVKDELKSAGQDLITGISDTKAQTLIDGDYIKKLFQNKDDIIAFNLIEQNGTLSVYTGRSISTGDDEDAVGIHSGSRIHQKADEHLATKQSGVSTSSTDDFENVSDYREDGDLEAVSSAEGYAQLRTYVDEYNDNEDVNVVRSRVDQRVDTPQGACDTFIGQSDQTITHDHDEDSTELDDWTPNPNNEDDQTGSSTVTLSRSGIEYSYTYDHDGDITVTDDSPFEEETSRARIEMPGRNPSTNPDRIRSGNASLVKVNESTISSQTWSLEWHIFDYYSGRCMYQSLPMNLTTFAVL